MKLFQLLFCFDVFYEMLIMAGKLCRKKPLAIKISRGKKLREILWKNNII